MGVGGCASTRDRSRASRVAGRASKGHTHEGQRPRPGGAPVPRGLSHPRLSALSPETRILPPGPLVTSHGHRCSNTRKQEGKHRHPRNEFPGLFPLLASPVAASQTAVFLGFLDLFLVRFSWVK